MLVSAIILIGIKIFYISIPRFFFFFYGRLVVNHNKNRRRQIRITWFENFSEIAPVVLLITSCKNYDKERLSPRGVTGAASGLA